VHEFNGDVLRVRAAPTIPENDQPAAPVKSQRRVMTSASHTLGVCCQESASFRPAGKTFTYRRAVANRYRLSHPKPPRPE
jgi:hypothetical protein